MLRVAEELQCGKFLANNTYAIVVADMLVEIYVPRVSGALMKGKVLQSIPRRESDGTLPTVAPAVCKGPD